MSRVTDGDVRSWSYAEWWSGLNYVMVDLWREYDISKLNIKHYYTDGRTSLNTKTEVSADGKTWTTIFDSAVSWTYPEPKDGSGRTYTLKQTESTEETDGIDKELEDELRKLFEELGIDYDTTTSQSADGVEINSNWIRQSLRDKIDNAVSKGTVNWIWLVYWKLEVLKEMLESEKYQTYTKRDYYLSFISYFLESIDKDGRLIVRITDFEYTKKVDNWYVWWVYFKVNNPENVKEAGIEYYNAKSSSPWSWIPWEENKVILEGTTDGEYSSFIIPKN